MKPQWTPGNRFELLENGEVFYPRVLAAIGEARREVLLETFILFDDAVGRRLRAALLAAARRGVRVHVLVDGWGSPDLDEQPRQELHSGEHLVIVEQAGEHSRILPKGSVRRGTEGFGTTPDVLLVPQGRGHAGRNVGQDMKNRLGPGPPPLGCGG